MFACLNSMMDCQTIRKVRIFCLLKQYEKLCDLEWGAKGRKYLEELLSILKII